jgi:Ca-activated chloride channel family protein
MTARRPPWQAALLGLAALAAAGTGGPARACALELILAVDVSGSIDAEEFDLQTGGLAAAFEHDSLVSAVSELEGGMIVTMTQWSGISRQRQMTGWHHAHDRASLAALAASIRSAGRAWRNFSTAVGEALEHARAVSADAPMPCARRVIDVSGDGMSNEGRPPAADSAELAAAGFTVNALVIRGADPDPVPHFRDEVIAGPGAFVEIADGFDDYPRAILRKLLREIDQPLIVSGDIGP